MKYVFEIIPEKFYGNVYTFSKIKMKHLYKKFLKNSEALLNKVVNINPNFFESDLEALKDELFKNNSYDYLYSAYDITPIKFSAMVEIVDSLKIHEVRELFFISMFLVKNNLALNGFSSAEIKKLNDNITKFNELENILVTICINKNLNEILLEHSGIKSSIEANIEKYLKSIDQKFKILN